MLAGTHTLLPVCAFLLVERVVVRGKGRSFLPRRSLWLVGFYGLLPDILTPHLSLEARHASWSHSLLFLFLLGVVTAAIASRLHGKQRWRIAAVCWVSTALHLAADAISGGISWFHPWSKAVLGSYLIRPEHWMWFDAGFVLLTWLLIRVVPIRISRDRDRNAQVPEIKTPGLSPP